MGNKYEVHRWILNTFLDEYYYEVIYAGESFIKAYRVARKAKKAGAGCVKIEWR